MDILIIIYNAVISNIGDITEAIACLIAGASIIIKLTPTLQDDNYWKPIVKFIGKYIALDKYGPNSGA